MSDYYDPLPVTIASGTRALAAQVNAISNAISAGFDKLPTEAEFKTGTVMYSIDTGVADAYIVTLPYTTEPLIDGFQLSFKTVNANTGPATLNVNGTGVKAIINPDGSALIANTFSNNAIIIVAFEQTSDSYVLVSQNPAQSALANAAAIAAAASEANAAASEANAAASEANAATSEGNAATSEANALASENAAQATLDDFETKYLGAKAADPLLDNQGNPLIDGALYYNTTANQMNVYDLGTTTWIPFGAISNADTLDGLDSTQFLRSDVSNTFVSGVTTGVGFDNTETAITSGQMFVLTANNAAFNGEILVLDQSDGTAQGTPLQINQAGDGKTLEINSSTVTDNVFQVFADALTTGVAAIIESDNAGHTGNVVEIINAGSGTALNINGSTPKADLVGTGLTEIRLAGGGSVAGTSSLDITQNGTAATINNLITGGSIDIGTEGNSVLAIDGTQQVTIQPTYPFVAAAATATNTSIRLPHGTAPTAPTDGDMWTTTSSAFVRINGVTQDLLAGGGGDVTKVGTPANDQVGVWTGDGTIEGTANLIYNGSVFQATGAITASGGNVTANGGTLVSTFGLGLNLNNLAARMTMDSNAEFEINNDGSNTLIGGTVISRGLYYSSGAKIIATGDSPAQLAFNTDTVDGTINLRVGDNNELANAPPIWRADLEMLSSSGGLFRFKFDGGNTGLEIREESLSVIGGRVRFPPVNNPSTGANDLDDYQEGTWTPTLQDDSGSDAEGQTYGQQAGEYTKIGRVVYFTGHIIMAGLGTLSGGNQARIAGLPFASNAAAAFGTISGGLATGMSITAGQTVTGVVGQSDTRIELEKWDLASGTSPMGISEFSATGRLMFSGFYHTDL